MLLECSFLKPKHMQPAVHTAHTTLQANTTDFSRNGIYTGACHGVACSKLYGRTVQLHWSMLASDVR